nr:uncharacterized protein LOC125640260 [Caretta caretta]
MEASFGGEVDDEEEEIVDSSQQGSRETGFPNSQDLFITLDLDPVPPKPTQGGLPDPEGGEGTSAAYVSPSQRLVKIRRRIKCTRDEMFSDLMLSSHTDRAQQNTWRQTISECRKTQYDCEERWRAEDGMVGGISLLKEGRNQCSGFWRIKLICSSVWLSCRKGSRSTDRRYSPCVTNHPPPQVPEPPHPDAQECGGGAFSHPTLEDCPSNRRLAFNKF